MRHVVHICYKNVLHRTGLSFDLQCCFFFQNFDSRTRKLVQKTNHDSWSKKNRKTFDINYKTDIPKEFDARQYFINCANVIGDVKDQGNCASSWVNKYTFHITISYYVK